jgi:phosphoglycerate dehydrogenase-like enzyme
VLIAQLQGIDAVIASTEPYTPQVLEAARLRVISRTGVGYDAIDVPAATRRGVVVTITAGTNQHSVAESAIALLTGVFRGLPWRHREVETGRWTRRALPRLMGKTIGLVGLGRIGRAMVPRCQGLGLHMIAHDPLADTAWAADHAVRLCTFDELLQQADIVSLHLPASAENVNLIDAAALAKMKPGAVLINTSRGALVDEDALVEALRSGRLLGAGLDVFKIEPLPLDSPLLALDNLLMLPHVAGLDEESQEATALLAAQSIIDLHQGRWPAECVVNGQLRDGWRW